MLVLNVHDLIFFEQPGPGPYNIGMVIFGVSRTAVQLDISDDVEHEDDDVADDPLESAHILMYEDRQNIVDIDRVNIGESSKLTKN